MNINYVAVSGYGWSGSGAVVDLLREFDGFNSFDFEFSMIWEPNGIIDLENALVKNWDFLGNDSAIKNFINYCHVLDRKGGKFSKWGGNISTKFSIDFIKESDIFIDALTDIKYSGYTRLHDYNLSALLLFIKRIKRKLRIDNNSKNMYLSRPTEEKFLLEVKKYFNRLFQEYVYKNNVQTLIFDQSISISNISTSVRYFNKIKCIVVDRDPRDIYIDLINHKALIGLECINGSRESTKKYIKWHRALRQNSKELQQMENKEIILNLKFEEVVLRPELVIDKINNFLNVKLTRNDSVNYFNPNMSKKNIGLWKTYKFQKEIDFIYEELKEYCYKG
jgi:hypothetical protein